MRDDGCLEMQWESLTGKNYPEENTTGTLLRPTVGLNIRAFLDAVAEDLRIQGFSFGTAVPASIWLKNPLPCADMFTLNQETFPELSLPRFPYF